MAPLFHRAAIIIRRGPVSETTYLAAHTQNHVSIEWGRKSVTTVVLDDHDFLLKASHFGDLAAFRAIFSHIFTARAQKRPFMSFRWKFWHRHTIPRSWFLYTERYFGDLKCLLLIFAGDKLNIRHILTSDLVGLLTQKMCHVFCLWPWKCPPSLKLIWPSVAGYEL